MAKFRHVHTTFWEDPKVSEEMTPEDKYFYLYLLTNPKTTQIGIYQITKKQMSFDLGYSIEAVNSLMERFVNYHKLICYDLDTRELLIKNWSKYNLNKGGKPVVDCVRKELKEVKNLEFIRIASKFIQNEAVLNEYKKYLNDDTCHDTSDDTLTIGGQKEKEKEKEKENKTYAHSENANVTKNSIKDIKEKEVSKVKTIEYSEDFEKLWKQYPNKKDKRKAYLKYMNKLKEYSYETIEKGMNNYVKECEEENRYFKHLTTFLNGDCFMEYQEEQEKKPKRTGTAKSDVKVKSFASLEF